MGSTDDDINTVLQTCADCQRSWFTDEQPPHTVQLDAFWIDRSEVTNAQFAAFLNEHGNQAEGGVAWLDVEDDDCPIEWVGGEFRPKDGYAEQPVVDLSWYGAMAYCQWVGGRLPTEAEWEYAARGPEGRIYPWGNEFDCAGGNFADSSTGCGDGHAQTAPVGSFPAGASWCGALDMAGNVSEWVADWYDAGYYTRSPPQNPPGSDAGGYRVLRGGAWNIGPWGGRGAYRGWNMPSDRGVFVGFRCVVPVGE